MDRTQLDAMITLVGTGAALMHPAAGAAVELVEAGAAIYMEIATRQQEREAEGRSLSSDELAHLMAQGDMQEKLHRAAIAQAQLAKQAAIAGVDDGESSG